MCKQELQMTEFRRLCLKEQRAIEIEKEGRIHNNSNKLLAHPGRRCDNDERSFGNYHNSCYPSFRVSQVAGRPVGQAGDFVREIKLEQSVYTDMPCNCVRRLPL